MSHLLLETEIQRVSLEGLLPGAPTPAYTLLV